MEKPESGRAVAGDKLAQAAGTCANLSPTTPESRRVGRIMPPPPELLVETALGMMLALAGKEKRGMKLRDLHAARWVQVDLQLRRFRLPHAR
jgi:hypothetical protein